MSYDQILRQLGARPLVVLAVALFGLALVAAAVVSLIRRARRPAGRRWPARPALLLLVLGCLACAFAGFVFVQRPEGLAQMLRSDYQDPEKLARLETAPLDTVDRAETLPGAWPQWRGPHRDGVSPEVGLRSDWTRKPPDVVWKRPVGNGFSSIAVVGDRLYTMDRQGGDERVLCLDAAAGKERWSYRYPVDYSGMKQGYATGPRATPTVAGGRVYTVGATGTFLCLEADPADGRARALWQHDLVHDFEAPLPTWGVACSPLIEGKLVIVQPGGAKGSVAAYHAADGSLAWTALADRPGYSSPVAVTIADTRQVVAFTATELVGLRPEDGSLLWSFPWWTANEANIATPIVAGNYVFISTDYGAGCALVEVTPDGSGGFRAAPAYTKRKLMRNHHASSVLYRGFLYGFDVDGAGTLKCVDPRTGEEKWANRRLAKGSLLAADGHLIILTEDGTLVLLDASPTAFREQGRVADVLAGPQCWAMPALAAGRLYLRDGQQVVCLDVAGK